MYDDDREFQVLLEEEATPPDVSSELPGVVLENELVGPATALDEEPEPAFEAQSVAALENSDIQVDEQIRASRAYTATVPIMIACPNDIVYEVELGADEPDEGLHNPPTHTPIPNVAGYGSGRYPTRSCRSVLGNRPYD